MTFPQFANSDHQKLGENKRPWWRITWRGVKTLWSLRNVLWLQEGDNLILQTLADDPVDIHPDSKHWRHVQDAVTIRWRAFHVTWRWLMQSEYGTLVMDNTILEAAQHHCRLPRKPQEQAQAHRWTFVHLYPCSRVLLIPPEEQLKPYTEDQP